MPPRSSAGFPPLRVNYYRRMKQGRVYPVTVSWNERPKPLGSIKHVTVRLLGAGAQVVPSEQTLDAAKPDLKATFFVTPLAYGWLRAQRVEVLVGGRKVQEIPLASRVTCQCWAIFWFLMAIALPLLLIWMQSWDPRSIDETLWRHVPRLPALITDHAPVVGEYWDKAWEWTGTMSVRALTFNRERLLAFPTAVTLLILSLLSLFMNRDKRARRRSEPVPIPTGMDD